MHEFDVVIIGGGATGGGIARDAAMRGFKTLLIERGEIGSGTSGKYHGVLHSGGRYAVDDPESAKECIQENIILKKIARRAIDDTGGLFISTADDDLEYSEKFFTICKRIGIAIDELPVDKALRKEPHLQPKISRVFAVPDAVCDSQKLIRMNIRSAQEYGSQVLTHHEVTGFEISDSKIQAVHVLNISTGVVSIIACQFVINAAGVWTEKIAHMAAVPFFVAAVKGSMAVMQGRLTNTVLNRCRPPGDGDILVPKGQTSIIGTTSVAINNANTLTTEQWETDRLLQEGEKMIQNFSKQTLLYTYAGVRPLFSETGHKQAGRKISRTFTLSNHTQDGIDNMLTIVGGKLTTYRAMAQATVDTMCQTLNSPRICTTMKEPLPSVDRPQRKLHHFVRHLVPNKFSKRFQKENV